MAKHICISCKVNITTVRGSTKFECPSCEKAVIVRCGNCRQIAAKYNCSECSFTGP